MAQKTQNLPDFVNASPKSRFACGQPEEGLDGEVLLGKEQGLREVSPVLWHPYSDCCDCLRSVKYFVNTHSYIIAGNQPLQFLVDFIGDEADTDVSLDSSFCKMKHWSHLQCPF